MRILSAGGFHRSRKASTEEDRKDLGEDGDETFQSDEDRPFGIREEDRLEGETETERGDRGEEDFFGKKKERSDGMDLQDFDEKDELDIEKEERDGREGEERSDAHTSQS